MDVFTPAQEDAGESIPFDSEMKDIRKKLHFDVSPFDKNQSMLHSKQPVQVYIRIRPKSALEIQMNDHNCLHPVSDTTLLAIAPRPCRILKGYGRGPVEQSKQFYFSHIYNEESTQSDIFNECVIPVLEDFVDGQNCLLFSYGVTNSGKSYTITGTSKEPGVLPRTLDVIFNSIKHCHFLGHTVKPKFFAEATHLTDSEQEEDKAIKTALLNKATTIQPQGSCDQFEGSCDQPLQSCDQHSVIEDPTPNLSTVLENVSATSDVSSCVSKMTFEAGSIGASLFEDLSVHEEHVIDVDTQDDNISYSIWMSFAEIYNEFIYDLLVEDPVPGKPRPSLKLSEDRNKNAFIKGLREVKVESTEEAIKLLQLSLRHRHIAGTRLNYQSSRSHAVFTIKIIRIVKSARKPRVTRINRFSIVDLAGSERSKKTGARGDRCREASSINTSLLVLGRCIEAMRHNQRAKRKTEATIVPFRDSKLTKLLQAYFIGKGKCAREGKVAMILNVSNNASVFNETAHVLKFSALASKVVPSHNPAVKALMTIPELSPMKLLEEEEEREEELVEGVEWVGQVLEGVSLCVNCESLERKFDLAKKEVVDLKLKLWEQDIAIRQQLSREFNEQVVEIQDRMNVEMEEQEHLMEEEMQKRMMLFQQSTKKHYSRKRRRCSPEDEDEVERERLREMEGLRRLKRKLQEELREMEEDMERERDKNASEMRDLMSLNEQNMSTLRSQHNETIMAARDLTKRVQELEEQIAKDTEERERREEEEGAKYEERERKLELEIESLEHARCSLKEELGRVNEKGVAKGAEFELQVKDMEEKTKKLMQANAELIKTCERLRSENESRITDLEGEVTDLMEENGGLREKVYLAESHRQEEWKDRMIQLEEEVKRLKEENKKLTESSSHDAGRPVVGVVDPREAGVTVPGVAVPRVSLLRKEVWQLKEENGVLKSMEEVYDTEKEDMLLQIVSLEASSSKLEQKKGILEKNLRCKIMENEIEVDELKGVIDSLTNEVTTLRACTNDKTSEEEIQKYKEASTSLQLKVTELETALSNMEHEKHEEVEKWEKECETLKSNVTKLQSAMEKMECKQKKEIKQSKEECEGLQLKLTDLELTLKEVRNGKRDEAEKSEKVSKHLQSKVTELQTALTKVEREKETENQEERNQLELKLADIETTLRKVEQERQEQVGEYGDRIECLTSELSSLHETVKLEEEEMATLREKTDTLEAERKALREKERVLVLSLEREKETVTKTRNDEAAALTSRFKEKVTLTIEPMINSSVNRLQKELEQRIDNLSDRLSHKNDILPTLKQAMAKDSKVLCQSLLEELKTVKGDKIVLEKKLREKEEDCANVLKQLLEAQSVKSADAPVAEEHVYDLPPDAILSANEQNDFEDEHVYDSVHSSFVAEIKKKEENILDDTRKFPLLDRSSMLRDSLEDFESPKRFITYNMLTDAKKPKKTRGRAARKKKAVTHSDNNSEDECLLMKQSPATEGPTSRSRRYLLRSRKKKEIDVDSENIPPSPSSPMRVLSTPPLLKKVFKSTRKAHTTVKKKRTIRKSQISGPIDLSDIDSPVENSKKPSLKVVLKPVRKPTTYI